MSRYVTITSPDSDEGSECFNIIADHGTYLEISPLNNPEVINWIIRHSDESYSVYGTDLDYQISFQCRTRQTHRKRQIQGPNVAFLTQPQSVKNITSIQHLEPIPIHYKDFDYDVPLSDLKPAYRPIYDRGVTHYTQENILGEPLFLSGDQWPLQDGRPMSFSIITVHSDDIIWALAPTINQFWDPSEPQTFVQLFMGDMEGNEGGLVKRINRREFESRPIVHIPTPSDYINKEETEAMIRKGLRAQITGWTRLDTFDIGNLPQEFWDMLVDSRDYGTSADNHNILQLGGVPRSSQGLDLTDESVYYNNLYNTFFGDDGVVHMGDDGGTIGDMA